MQESGLTQSDVPRLADIQLDDAQKFAFHSAVAQLEAQVRLYRTLEPELPAAENAAAVFQFAQAATALTQVAASKSLREALQAAQDNQVRTIVRRLAQDRNQQFGEWAEALRNGDSRELVRASVEKALNEYKARFIQQAVSNVEGLDSQRKKVLQQVSGAVSAAARVREELTSQSQIFSVSDRLLREMPEFQGTTAVAATEVTAALGRLAQLEVGLRVEAAAVEARVQPLLEAQKLSEKTAQSLRNFVNGQNLSAVDAIRAPLLLASFTGNSDLKGIAKLAIERTLGKIPSETLNNISSIAESAKNLEMDFGGWQQTSKTILGVASLVVQVDPKLNEAVSQVTTLVATASSFIEVGQSIIQTVNQVSSGISMLSQGASLAATFFTTGGAGTALSVLSGMGSIGGLFGGSKRDDGAILAKLDVINQKLDRVLENQRKTMEAIVSVSEQLQQATNQIVKDIQKVSLQVTRVEAAQFDSTVRLQRLPCLQLYDEAKSRHQYDAVSGAFPPGERVRFWLNAMNIGQPSAPDTLSDCRRFLLNAGDFGDVPHAYLLDEFREFSQKNLGPTAGVPKDVKRSPEGARYIPMRDLTWALQGDEFSIVNDCVRKVFLPQALGAPRTFEEIFVLKDACNADIDLRPRKWLSDKLSDPTFVLQRMLHENSVREFSLFVDFFGPFVDMETALRDLPVAQRPQAYTSMQTSVASSFEALTAKAPICVAKPRFGVSTIDSAESLYHSALVTVNTALAQQYLLSGAGIALQTARLLKDPAFNFGEGPSAFPGSASKLADPKFAPIAVAQATGDLDSEGQVKGGTAPGVANFSSLVKEWNQARQDAANDKIFGETCNVPENYTEKPYATAACVLSANPTYVNNVLQALMLEHLREPVLLPGWAVASRPEFAKLRPSSRPVPLYATMLGLSQKSSMNQQFNSKGLPVVYLEGRRPGWFLKLRKHTGELWFWRLPEANLLASGHVYYPFSEGPLREAQALLTSRLADYAAMCLPSELRSDSKLLSRSAFFAPPRRPLEQDN